MSRALTLLCLSLLACRAAAPTPGPEAAPAEAAAAFTLPADETEA